MGCDQIPWLVFFLDTLVGVFLIDFKTFMVLFAFVERPHYLYELLPLYVTSGFGENSNRLLNTYGQICRDAI